MRHGNLRATKIRKWGGKFSFLFQGKIIIKRIKPSKCSKTYLQNIFHSTIFPWWYPQTLVKMWEGQKSWEDGGKKRGRLRHGCRNQNCASAHVVAWPTRKSQSCMLSVFPQWSLPAFRWDNSRPTHRETWPMATAFISSTKSFFGISYRQLSVPKDLTLSKNKCLSTSFTRSAH